MSSTSRRTIAHVVWSLDVGGLERVVVDLVNGVDSDRFESVVYALISLGTLSDEIVDRCRAMDELHKKPGRAWLLPFRLARLMRRDRVDVLHAHNFGPLLYGSVAARLARVKGVVYTLHGPEASQRHDFGRVDRIRPVDRIVSVSDHVGDVAIETGAMEADRVTTVYNGVDTGRYAVGSEDVRERMRADLGIEADSALVGVVARLTYEKDHANLLQAFAQLLSTHPAAYLAVVGDGELRATLEEMSAALGLGQRVLFLGTRRDVPELMSAFDLFVLPSRIEGLGITLVEAMSAGLPTVATAVGGILEVVTSDTGLTVEKENPGALADAIAWMLDHPVEAARMGQAGRRRARETFGIETMVRRYEQIYLELTEGYAF